MTIHFAILGLLSQKEQTGYDLKKSIARSDVLHWSGNNNQIYTSLLQLQADGLVQMVVEESSGHPARKIYAITAAGKAGLMKWLMSQPPLPELKNHFLVQFLFCHLLPAEEIRPWLDQYQSELEHSLLLHQEQARRAEHTPFAQLAAQNLAEHDAAELAWLRRARIALLGNENNGS